MYIAVGVCILSTDALRTLSNVCDGTFLRHFLKIAPSKMLDRTLDTSQPFSMRRRSKQVFAESHLPVVAPLDKLVL